MSGTRRTRLTEIPGPGRWDFHEQYHDVLGTRRTPRQIDTAEPPADATAPSGALPPTEEEDE
jgi:hypothetical protein